MRSQVRQALRVCLGLPLVASFRIPQVFHGENQCVHTLLLQYFAELFCPAYQRKNPVQEWQKGSTPGAGSA
jgi:hypothetical protein